MILDRFFGKREKGKALGALTQKLSQDHFSRELLNKLNAFGIRLKVVNKKCGFTMGSNFYTREILIPIREVNKFLEGKGSQNFFRAEMAHELGHFLCLPDDEKAIKDFIEARLRGRSCGIKKDCLYEELLANKFGFELLKELGIENLRYEKMILYLAAFLQCENCFVLFKSANCPKIDDLKKLGEEAEKELQLS